MFYNQKVRFRNIIREEELKYMKFFRYKTSIFCENIILNGNYVFFFVKPQHYRKANRHLSHLRVSLPGKKIQIIKNEGRLLDLIYAFFPNTKIQKVELKVKPKKGDTELLLFLEHFEESESFIKILNEVFYKYIYPVKIIIVMEGARRD